MVSVPVWTKGEALPIGVQIIAPPWREDLALRVARALEREGVVSAPIGEVGMSGPVVNPLPSPGKGRRR